MEFILGVLQLPNSAEESARFFFCHAEPPLYAAHAADRLEVARRLLVFRQLALHTAASIPRKPPVDLSLQAAAEPRPDRNPEPEGDRRGASVLEILSRAGLSVKQEVDRHRVWLCASNTGEQVRCGPAAALQLLLLWFGFMTAVSMRSSLLFPTRAS